jgi:hypothetical protein
LLTSDSLPCLGPAISLDSISELRDIYSLFMSRCDYFDEEDFFASLFISSTVKVTLAAFEDIVNELFSKVNIDAFEISPIIPAIRMLRKAQPGFCDEWKQLIHRLLELGPDLHASHLFEGETVLDQIMDIAESPFESHEVGEQWLSILESFGFDIEDYLQTERIYQYEGSTPILTPHMGFFNMGDDIPKRYMVFSEYSPRISWDWHVDPESHAFEALHEFRNLGYMHQDPVDDHRFPERMLNWPYVYPRWQSLNRFVHWHTNTEEMRCSLRALITVFENRFEHRWLKKVKKLRRAQGFGKSPRLPGAWID